MQSTGLRLRLRLRRFLITWTTPVWNSLHDDDDSDSEEKEKVDETRSRRYHQWRMQAASTHQKQQPLRNNLLMRRKKKKSRRRRRLLLPPRRRSRSDGRRSTPKETQIASAIAVVPSVSRAYSRKPQTTPNRLKSCGASDSTWLAKKSGAENATWNCACLKSSSLSKRRTAATGVQSWCSCAYWKPSYCPSALHSTTTRRRREGWSSSSR